MKHKKSITKKDSKTKIEIQKTIFEKIYFYFFLLLPIIYSDKLVDPVLIPRQIYLSIFVFIVGVLICYQISIKKLNGDFTFLKTPLFLGFSIFLISILISFFQSIVISESIYTFSKVLIEVCFLALTSYLIIQKQLSIRSLMISVICFVATVIFMTFYELFGLMLSEETTTNSFYEITSNFGHKNLLSSILFLSFPFLLNAVFISKRWKIVAIPFIILVISLIWILQTRAVILSFVLYTFVFFLLLYLKKRFSKSRFSIKKTGLTILVLILFLAVITYFNADKFNRLFNVDSAFERISMWENTLKIIHDHFLKGIGAGNWQIYFPENGLDKFPEIAVRNGMTTFQRPHNDFLWVFSELGILGIYTYLSLFFTILMYSIRLLIVTVNRQEIWLYSSLLAAVIGYVFIAFVDFPFERIEHQIFLFLIFSILFAKYYEQFIFIKSNRLTTSHLALFLVCFLVPLFSFVVSFNRFKGEFHTHLLYENHKINNWNGMIETANQTKNYFYQLDPTSVPINWYKGVAEFSNGDMKFAKISFEKAYSLNPYNIHVLNNLATCYANLGDTKKAILFYQKVLKISSKFEEAILNLSGLYYNIHQFDKAFTTINKCNENSIDTKYIQFLYPILIEKMNKLIEKERNEEKKQQLIDVKFSYDELMKIFFDSKKNNTKFEYFLLNKLKS